MHQSIRLPPGVAVEDVYRRGDKLLDCGPQRHRQLQTWIDEHIVLDSILRPQILRRWNIGAFDHSNITSLDKPSCLSIGWFVGRSAIIL